MMVASPETSRHGVNDAIQAFVKLGVCVNNNAHGEIDNAHAQGAYHQNLAQQLRPPGLVQPSVDLKQTVDNRQVEGGSHQ